MVKDRRGIRLLFEVGHLYHRAALDPLYQVFRQDERYDIAFTCSYDTERHWGIFNRSLRRELEGRFRREGLNVTRETRGFDVVIVGDTVRDPRRYGTALLCFVNHGTGIKNILYRNLRQHMQTPYQIFVEGTYRAEKIRQAGVQGCSTVHKVGLPKLDPLFWPGYPTRAHILRRLGLGFIRNHAGKNKPPFFMFVGTNAPHGESGRKFADRNPRPAQRHYGVFEKRRLPDKPSFNEQDVSDKPEFLQVPRIKRKERLEIRDRYRGRLESLLSVDEMVTAFVKELRNRGQLSNTLFIFTSDNGPHKEGGQDPNFFNPSGPLNGFKRDHTDGGIRVPFIAWWPGKIPAGTESAKITSMMDILPTFVKLAGGKLPAPEPLLLEGVGGGPRAGLS